MCRPADTPDARLIALDDWILAEDSYMNHGAGRDEADDAYDARGRRLGLMKDELATLPATTCEGFARKVRSFLEFSLHSEGGDYEENMRRTLAEDIERILGGGHG
jgi:hypothetical protein